jgi:hypothetical protein
MLPTRAVAQGHVKKRAGLNGKEAANGVAQSRKKNWRKEEVKNSMMRNKKIALLVTILMATLIVGVYAGMRLSNILTADWTVVETRDKLVLSWDASEPDGNIEVGKYYGTYIRLTNIGEATYNVIVKFKLWASGLPTIPSGSIIIQYWDGDSWEPVGNYHWDSYVEGYFGPTTGFTCGPGYNQVTQLRYMFNANAPRTGYAIEIWVEEVP